MMCGLPGGGGGEEEKWDITPQNGGVGKLTGMARI